MRRDPQAVPYDIVIRNGHIIDGTGSPWYSGDVAIRGGRIAALGKLDGAPAKRTIDARGMVVAPGFIDMLGQSELTILVDPHHRCVALRERASPLNAMSRRYCMPCH